MKNTGKIITAIAGLAVIVAFAATGNKQSYSALHAEDEERVLDLWGKEVTDFFKLDYSPIKNQKITGKYYKCGIMGHRRVVKYGDVRLKTGEVEKFTESTSYGALQNLEITNKYSHEIGKKTSFSEKISIGHSKIIKAGFTFGNGATVGAEDGKTIKGEFGIETSYWETDITSVEITQNLNLDNLIDGRKMFRYSKVACFVEADIQESYTEEQNMFGKWGRVGGTTNKNYKARYYVSDMNVFVYPTQKTFGDKVIGEYELDEIIKKY